MSLRIVRRKAAMEYVGRRWTTLHNRINSGLFPPGFRLGAGSLLIAWFEHELDAMNAADARGADDDEVRRIVNGIVEARKTIGAKNLQEV